ncbi:MAG: hypothetical protein HYW48_12675 [Deltaproteobacteria bacterium]|nr:hypothetical protein [Deltaproteobacteria bacterium]
MKSQESIYFVGLSGIGMATVAGLVKEAGYTVLGSDQNIFPPASDLLREMNIPVLTPYARQNVEAHAQSLFVIGNSLSAKHPEIAAIVEKGLPYKSFPQLLNELFLQNTKNVVVCGTHGKTTTSSLLAFCLMSLGEDPSYMIGGAPHDLGFGFHVGKGKLFILEGDEYDTAFFDKGSKFLHYNPSYIVLNHLELDHADIFKDFEAVKATFHKLLDLAPSTSVVANPDDSGVGDLMQEHGWEMVHAADVRLKGMPRFGGGIWQGDFETKLWGTLHVSTSLPGAYNFSNIAQVLRTLSLLTEKGELRRSPTRTDLELILAKFHGVAKRFDRLSSQAGVDVYLDFAHHPTAVRNVLQNLRQMHPHSRIIVAFEPKNATSRRSIFQHEFAEVFKLADVALIGPTPHDPRLSDKEKLDTHLLAESISKDARAFSDFESLGVWLQTNYGKGDVVAFLTCGDFGGVHRTFVKWLETTNSLRIAKL